MDEDALIEFKHSIVQLKLSLLDQIQHGQTQTVQLDQSKVGRLSRMDALQNQQMTLENQRRYEHKQIALDGALRRIENGDFGYCFVCEAAIAIERLRVDPLATRCIHCVQEQSA